MEKKINVKNKINILQDNLGGYMHFVRIKEIFLIKTGNPKIIKEKVNVFD